MSFITTNYKENKHNNFEPLPTGTYELLINKVQEHATPSGAESMQIDFIVRNDLDNVPELSETNAKYHNRHVFMENWKRHATNQYDTKGFQYLLEAAQVPEGTSIDSIDDFMNILTGKPMRVYVKKDVDDYQTERQNKKVYRNDIAPYSVEKSKFPQVNHQQKNNAVADATVEDPFADKSNSNKVNISNDNLPF